MKKNTKTLTFKNMAAQGDLMLRRIAEVPEGFEPVKADTDGGVIVAHSETGHHHVLLSAKDVAVMGNPREPGRMIAVVNNPEGATLEHRRAWDTHAPIVIPPGFFELRRQREETPEGWRRVTD